MNAAERTAPLSLLSGGGEEPLPEVRATRDALARMVGCALLAAAAPAYLFLSPDWIWKPESLLIALVAFSFLCAAAAITVRGDNTMDASFIPALIGVVFLGPLPAACIYGLTMIDDWIRRGGTVPLLGNTASAFWGVWAAAWTLEGLTGGVPVANVAVQDLPAIALAGAVLLAVNYFVIALVVNVLWRGHDLAPLVQQELGELAPATALLLAIGTVTVLLYELVGLPGLAPLALLVVLPRMIVPRLSRAHVPAMLERDAATALYARAIAAKLELGADQRRVLMDAVTHLGDSKQLTRIEDFDRVMQTVLLCRRRWDVEAVPIESRVLGVAQQLADLTARGTRGLTASQAIKTLVPRAGTEFDPRVVAAARWAIENEFLVTAPRPAGKAPFVTAGSSWRRPGGRTRSRRNPSGGRRVRLARPWGSGPTSWPVLRRHQR